MPTWSKEETTLRERVRKEIKNRLPEGSQVQVNRISAVTNPHTNKSGISIKCKIVLLDDPQEVEQHVALYDKDSNLSGCCDKNSVHKHEEDEDGTVVVPVDFALCPSCHGQERKHPIEALMEGLAGSISAQLGGDVEVLPMGVMRGRKKKEGDPTKH